MFGREFTAENGKSDLGFTVDLRSTMDLRWDCLAKQASPDPRKGILVGMARFALGP
jgi:hypothetical protein